MIDNRFDSPMNDQQRTFRLIVIFMAGFAVAYVLNMLMDTQRASVSVQNIVSFALAPVVTTIGVVAFMMWRERQGESE
jgi:fructose-specific phosphotransferase system IIC component